MKSKIGNRPLNCILNPLSFRLAGDPQFEVFKAIVVLYSILVMYILVAFQWSAKVMLHKVTMLKMVLSIPTNTPVSLFVKMSAFEFCVRHTSLSTRFRAVFDRLISGYFERFTAISTNSLFKRNFSFGGVLASMRTVFSSSNMRFFGKISIPAMMTCLNFCVVSAFKGAVFLARAAKKCLAAFGTNSGLHFNSSFCYRKVRCTRFIFACK